MIKIMKIKILKNYNKNTNYGTIQYYNFIFIAVILNGKLIYVT